jgi:ribosomal protein RSM22 (predicted rRNA methylase)
VERLWEVTGTTLVVIEPGTPRGYKIILAARDSLIHAGANVIAPCPHDDRCPMTGADWCHFSQRLSRTVLHRAVKGATLGYEDEKYAYVAVARVHGSPISGRVIRHPQVRSGHIYLELCTDTGLKREIVNRRDRSAFRRAHNLRWGAAMLPGAEDAT